MSDQDFDGLSKALATATSRRQALKILAAAVAGGALSLIGSREVGATPPCRRVGQPCRQDEECCDFFCPPGTGRCACPPDFAVCRRRRRCVLCPSPCTFDPETCQCDCPPCPDSCSDNPCGVDPVRVCGQNPLTGACLCAQTVTGECDCFQPICGVGPECSAEAPDCPAGFRCVNATCCGISFCAALCDTALPSSGAQRLARWG